jgi:hypothetical protein
LNALISVWIALVLTGTSTVEMLFGQLMLMTDGCGKLDVRQLQDVLRRLMLTNALRFLPTNVRGFPFLTQLKQHMKSYKPDDSESSEWVKSVPYPSLKTSDGNIIPHDSSFDKPMVTKKRKLYNPSKPASEVGTADVRRFHKKFN